MKYDHYYDYIIKVQSIARIGLTFSKDAYALENYRDINDISEQMLEDFQHVKFDRNNFFERDIYPTPNISNRTVIINDKNEILLVRESNSEQWSLPGGWCDLYDSPSEAAHNEISQEAGIEAKITRLIGILHRTPYKAANSVPEYVVVFEASIEGQKFHEHCHETDAVAFFPIDALPEMSRKLSMIEIQKILKACKNKETIFD